MMVASETERDTIVKWEIDFAEIDPQDLQSMEEKVVKNVVGKIGESIFGVQSKRQHCYGLIIGKESM